MKKIISCLVLASFVLNNTLILSPAFAKKSGSSTLSIKASDGGTTVYGSVLKPSENRLKIKIPASLLKAIRGQGIDNLTVSITKIATEGDESSVYSIPSENLTLVGKNLLIDLLPCLDTAGSTVTAGALADGSYSFQIAAGDSQFTGSFDYKAPAVVVGTVDTGTAGCNGGTNTLNSLSGSAISGAVALSSTCTFFNEVQAARKTKPKKKQRSLFQDAGIEDTSGDGADTFVYVDPVTDTEQTVAEVENVVVIEDANTGETEVVEVSAPVDLVQDAGGDNEIVVDAGSTQEYDNAVDNADANNNGEIDTPQEVQALEDDLSDNTSSTSSSGSTSSSSTSSSGSVNNPELKPIQDPKAICERLREGVTKLKDCKGSDCPKPPCFPDDLRAKLKEVCAELIALIPAVKCDRPQPVCGLQGGQSQQPGQPPVGGTSGQPPVGGTSGQPGEPPTGGTSGQTPPPPATSSGQPLMAQVGNTSGQLGGPGQPNAGPGPNDGQCQDFRPPQQPSICKLCNTAGPEGCTGPALVNNTAKDGTTCILPEVQCIPFTAIGKTTPDAMFDGICLFGDGDLIVGEEDDKPKDPNTCKPFQFDPGLACPQVRPTCKPTDDLSTIEKACCQLPQGQPSGTSSGQPPVTRLNPDQFNEGIFTCVLRKLCSDPSNFGVDGKPDSTKLESLKAACSGQGQPASSSGQSGGMSGQPKPDPACVEGCKLKCGTDQACLQECGKTCFPSGTSSGQAPCDPTKDPNCKPPTTGDCPQGQVKDPATGECKPSTGTGDCPQGQVKDPATGECKPSTGTGDCPQGQVKDPATGQCKPSTGTGDCPQGQVKDPATGQCKPSTGTGDCPQGQIKDPATGQCKPADGGTQPVTCPQGQTLCSDGKTCKTNTAECPQGGTQPPPTTCPQGQVKCADGSCKVTCPQ